MIRLNSRTLPVALLAFGATLWPATPASAEATHHVFRTEGQGVWLHTVPSVQDGLLVVLPEASEFVVQCWTTGDDVLGNSIWLYGSSALGTGYVTDYYVDTVWNTTADLEAQGIPNCSAVSSESDLPFGDNATGEVRQ